MPRLIQVRPDVLKARLHLPLSPAGVLACGESGEFRISACVYTQVHRRFITYPKSHVTATYSKSLTYKWLWKFSFSVTRIVAWCIWSSWGYQRLRVDVISRCKACFPNIWFCFVLSAEFHGLWDSLVYDVEVKSHVSCAFPRKASILQVNHYCVLPSTSYLMWASRSAAS